MQCLPEERFHKGVESGLAFEEIRNVEQASPQGNVPRPRAVFDSQAKVQGQGGEAGGRVGVAPDDRGRKLQEGDSVFPSGGEVDGDVDAPGLELLEPFSSRRQENPFSGADMVDFAFDFDGDMPFLQEPPGVETVGDTGMVRLLEAAAIKEDRLDLD